MRFHGDNLGVVQVINRITASSPPVIRLLQHLVLRCLQLNVFIHAVHLPGVENVIADALSRFQWERFRVGTGGRATRGSLSRLAVGDSIGLIAGWIKNSVSGSTWAAYTRVWHEWMEFVQNIGEEPVCREVRLLLIYYIARKMEEGVSASVVNRNVTGLAFLFKFQGQVDFTKDFLGTAGNEGLQKGDG